MTLEIDITGRAALVTGGGRGIGRSIALALAKAGADVALTYNRDQQSAQDTAGQVTALGRRAVVLHADNENASQVKQASAQAVTALGKVDILVSNAGIISRLMTVVDTPMEQLMKELQIHTIGAYQFCQELIPQMRQQPRGDIIFISSIATLLFAPQRSPYSMAKSSMEALARVLAKEERENNIRVNTIAPGLTDSDMARDLMKFDRGIDDYEEAARTFPFGRLAEPSEIGNLCAFLVSPLGGYITGQVIYVTGGQEYAAMPRND